MTRKKTKISLPIIGEVEPTDLAPLALPVMGEPVETTAHDRYVAEVLGVFNPNEDFDRARTDANVELLQILAQYLTDHPKERFGQALRNLDIVSEREVAINYGGGRESLDTIWENEFYTEPTAMLNRVRKGIANSNEAERRGG